MRGILANYANLKGIGNFHRVEGWKKPASGNLKLSVDVSFLPDSGTGAIGPIIRYSGGNFVAACSDSNAYAFDVASMEALALLAGLKLAEQIGGQSMMVETDSMEVVQAVLNPSVQRHMRGDYRQLTAADCFTRHGDYPTLSARSQRSSTRACSLWS